MNSTRASGCCTCDPGKSFSLPSSSAKKYLSGSGLHSAVSTTSIPTPLEASFEALLLYSNANMLELEHLHFTGQTSRRDLCEV